MQRIIKIILCLPVFYIGCKINQYSLTYPPNKPSNVLWTYATNPEPMILTVYKRDQSAQWWIHHYEVCVAKGFCQYIANLVDPCIAGYIDDNQYKISLHYLSDVIEDQDMLEGYPGIETLKLPGKRYCTEDYTQLQSWLNKSFWDCLDIKYIVKIARSNNECRRPYAIVDIDSINPEEFYSSKEPMISVHQIVPPSVDSETGLGFPCFIQFWPKGSLETLVGQEAREQIGSLISNKFRRQILAESSKTFWKFIEILKQCEDYKTGRMLYIPFPDISKFNNTTAQLLFGGEQFARIQGYIFYDYYRTFTEVNRGKRLNQNQRYEMDQFIQRNPDECIRRVFDVLKRFVIIKPNNNIDIFIAPNLRDLLIRFPHGSFISD